MDQCTQGLNFDTLRPREQILTDYKRVLEKVYDPAAYAGRLQRLERLLGKSAAGRQVQASHHAKSRLGGLEIVHRIVSSMPEGQDVVFKRTILKAAATNPQRLRVIVLLAAFYLHLGPFSRHVIRQIDRQLDGFENGVINPDAPIEQDNIAVYGVSRGV